MPELRRTLALAGILLAAIDLFSPHALAQDVTAYCVMDGDSGHVLLAQNERRKMGIGSLTDVATAMVVLDWLEVRKRDINEAVVIPPEAANFPQNPIGFQPGDQASVRDLLYAALMQSDDIAAYSLAVHVGQDLPPVSAEETPVQRFVAQMNALARKLGMRNTIFVNPTGLEYNERRLPHSTAQDLALLARYAMDRSQFRFYVSQKEREISIDHTTASPSGYALQNTNELLGIDSIDGVRTGTTRRSGPGVIISAARPPESVQKGTQYFITPRRLVVVEIGAPDRFGTAHQLLQEGWQAYDQWTAAGRPTKRS
ncbi:MAG TPA: serine hydrolase [Chthoniobacteraceae bacterium]|jgi:D-alanyl-D-alanine carboxypeptidase (penicillin-binding protein 5/6)|nr:serine hydrolase [Chthoniobacteraceae bacterium]